MDPEIAAHDRPPFQAELFTRFLREELGWEAWFEHPEGGWNAGKGAYSGVMFVRCASGETNPLYPNDPEARDPLADLQPPGPPCAPTIDGLRYETVSIDAAQLARRGPKGIWVVTRWQMLPPFEQLTPPSDAEIAEALNGFLEARVAGEGAERYLTGGEGSVPLMYETTDGAPYARGEFEVVQGPEWPFGRMELAVRLFAGETVVEQRFGLFPCYVPSLRGCETVNEDLTLFGPLTETHDGVHGTTENGQAVPLGYSIVDGEVTFAATNPPWGFDPDWVLGSSRTMAALTADFGGIRIVADPLPVGTGCEAGAAPADAQALAERILSDPDIEATEPTPIRIAGVEALQMDVAPAAGASICDSGNEPVLFTSAEPDPRAEVALWRSQVGLWHRHSYRVYLLDVPAGSSRILAVVVFAFDRDFDEVLEAATPVLDSFEFHGP